MKNFLLSLNDKFTVRRIALLILFFAAFNFSMIIRGEYRRDAAVEDLKASYRMSRSMLNARAQIQIILINASLEDRSLNPAEIDLIKQNWRHAEYDLVPEGR